jgi:hypothetical protein
MSLIKDQILNLTKQLLPTGRAFNTHNGSMVERMYMALSVSEEKNYLDIVSTLDSILPDNDNFTAEDATLWEKRLGLITNDLVSLSDRKLAIARKLNHPGTIKARQNYLYIQEQLRAAGFDVYVYENLNLLTIEDVLSINNNYGQLGTFQLDDQQLGDVYSYYQDLFDYVQLNDQQLGSFQLNEYVYTNKIVNHIDELKDVSFNVGSSLRSTFFIGGNPLGTFANVPIERKNEFRQLILKLKPVQTVGFLLINYN